MKKTAFFAAAVAALMTCACSIDTVDVVDVQPEEELTVLSAGFSGAEDGTRTVRQADGKVFWSPGDEISITRATDGSRGERFVSDITQPSPMANFTGRMPSGLADYWAIYPYREQDYYDGTYGFMITYIPPRQEAVAGTFAKDAFISAAYVDADATSLSFHHVCGGFKFSLTQPGIERVIVQSKNESILTGCFSLEADEAGGRPYVGHHITQYFDYAELYAPAGKTLAVGTDYHLVTRPTSLMDGFNMYFLKKDGTVAVRNVSKSVLVKYGHFATMMEVDRDLGWESFFEFSPSLGSVGAEGGVFSLHVHSSGAYHVDASNCDWIEEVGTDGFSFLPEGADVRLSAAPNDGPARTGVVVICSDVTGNCYPVTVSQGSGEGAKVIRHHSLGMLFTATWCQYCPNMHRVFNRASERLGDRLETISLYDPSGKFGLDATSELFEYYHFNGFPSALVDARFFVDDISPASAPQSIEDAVSESERFYPPVTAIALSSTKTGRTLTVQAEVFANVEDDFKITAFLVENGVIGFQLDGDTRVEDYRHDRVARVLVTNSSLGDPFRLAAGETKSFTYKATVPSSYNRENMEVLAYVQRQYGSRYRSQNGNYGDWYVDNCRVAPLGATVPLEVQ